MPSPLFFQSSLRALRGVRGRGDGRRVHEIEVGPAVPIEVEDGHAAAHRFEDVFLLRRERVLERDAARARDVGEERLAGRGLSCAGTVRREQRARDTGQQSERSGPRAVVTAAASPEAGSSFCLVTSGRCGDVDEVACSD